MRPTQKIEPEPTHLSPTNTNMQTNAPFRFALYPGLDLSKKFHEDDIFPKSRFTRKKLEAAGIQSDKVEDYIGAADLLPNLQIL